MEVTGDVARVGDVDRPCSVNSVYADDLSGLATVKDNYLSALTLGLPQIIWPLSTALYPLPLPQLWRSQLSNILRCSHRSKLTIKSFQYSSNISSCLRQPTCTASSAFRYFTPLLSSIRCSSNISLSLLFLHAPSNISLLRALVSNYGH